MERFVTKFWTEEDGNTTVDWMVLTAGLVLLGAAVMASVSGGSTDLADTTAITIEDVGTTAGL
jgi:hypothetical protein